MRKLYDMLVAAGDYTKSFEEFVDQYGDEQKSNKLYDGLSSAGDYTKSFDEFKTQYGFTQKKNPNVTSDSNLETEVTESITETPEQPGSLDSFVEETTETPDEVTTYVEEDLDQLMELAEKTVIPRGGVVIKTNPNPGLKEKILSDYNISKAISQGFIDEDLIDSALDGDADSIEKIKQLSVKNPQTYTDQITNKKLDKPFAFEESSNLVEYVTPEEEVIKKQKAKEKVDAFNKETERLLSLKPNATEEEMEAIFTREGSPTEEEFELAEEDFTPTGFEDSDVHRMYDTQKLKSIEGFNVKDFDGYLKEQGYMDRYTQLLEDETISEDGRFYDISGNYNPTLAAERIKAQYLTNYINNQIERNVESQVLKYQAENNGRHPSLDGVQVNFSSGVDDIALSTYIEEHFPSLTAKLKNQDVENQENYQKYLEGENPWFTQSVKQGWRSVEDRIHSFSKGVYGFVGMNSVADEIRMRDAQDDLERDDFMRYSYASGKKAFVNGREYGIDERGQIYDLAIKKNVTNVLTPNMADAIRKTVAQSDEDFKSFSGSGTVIATAGIASDMLLQIALTRGVGNVGRGGAALLGTFDKGKKVVSGLSSIPMKATTASAMIAQGTLFSTNLASSTYDQAIANGLDEATAVELRQKAGMQGFALGSITAPISTQTLAMDKIFGKAGTNKLSKGMVDAYMKAGDKGVQSYFQRIRQTVVQNYPVYAKEGAKEMIQENVQQAGQAFVIAPNINEVARREIMNNTITGAEYTNTTILAGLAGLLMPFGGDLSSTTGASIKAKFSPGEAAIDRLEALHGLSRDVDKTKKFLNSMVTQGVYTENQVSDLLSDIDVYVNTINNIPPNLSPETSLSVMNSVNEIRKLEQLKEQRDKSFHGEIDQKIEELRNEITVRTQFDFASSDGKLKLKEEAAKQLQNEAEQRGETEFQITDSQITSRAIDNFSKLTAEEKLEFVDKEKVTIKKPEEDASTEQSAMEETSADTTQDTQEVAEGISDTVREPSREADTEVETTTDQETQTEPVTDTDTEVDTTTEEEVMSVNEAESAPSKERVDQIVQDIVKKTKGRKVGESTNPEVILENTLNYLQNSKFYQEANDIEREEAVRQLNQELGIKITKPPTVKKILGKPKDKQVTVNERTALKDQLRLQAKAARESQLDYRQKQKQVLDGVNSLQKGGQLSPVQSKGLRNKIKKTNFDNDNQVESLLEYADKVFTNADYAAQEQQASTLNKRTRKKLNTGRLGNNSYFNNTISQILLTPVSEIKPEALQSYNEFLGKISKREKVTRLDKEIQKEAEALLNKIKIDPQVESELTFDKDKGFVYKPSTQQVIDKINSPDVDGQTLMEEITYNNLNQLDSVSLEILVDKLNLAETESNKEIVEAVNDYASTRQKIINDVANQASKTKLSNLPSTARDQSVGAVTLTKANKGDLAFLSGTELEQLQVHLDNIADGIYTYSANKLAQRIEANTRAATITPVVNKVVNLSNKLSMLRQRTTAAVKNQVAKLGLASKDAEAVGIVGQMIRSNPLSVIDQVFGNFKNNTIRENVIDPTATQYAKFKNWINGKTDKLEVVENLLAPEGKEGVNQSVKRRFEVTTYLLQKEFESNDATKGIEQAVKFIDKTIEKYESAPKKSRYTKRDIDLLKQIKNEYSENGQISLKKMEDVMSPKTKKAIKIIEEVYGDLSSLQVYATNIVRGDALDLVNNYVHHKVSNNNQEEDDQLKQATEYISIQPGTKSKTSISRTPGAKALDFDPIASALRAVRNTGMDYYLSNEISTTRQSLTETIQKVDDNKESKEAASDLKEVYNEAIGNVLSQNLSVNVVGGRTLDKLRTLGYYSTLASVPRAASELISNLAFTSLSTPTESLLGITKHGNLSISEKGRLVVENTGATTGTKLYNDEALGGSKADQQTVVRGKKGSAKTKSSAGEVGEKILRYTKAKQVGRGIEKVGELLISTPDQMVSRPLWFGTFAKTFKDLTGNDVDFDKIAEKDLDYMEENSDAIKKSTKAADSNVTQAATSNSPFSGVLKNQVRNEEQLRNWYRTVNSYMSRFSLNEYATARQAVASLVGRGQMGQIKGAGVLAGVMARMSLYVVLLKALSNTMYSALGIGDDDDESYEELFIRQGVGAATSLISRGMAGNVPMILPNAAIEEINKEYGFEFGLRDEKEYDPYKHSIIFSQITLDQINRDPYKRSVIMASGPLQPQVKALDRVIGKAKRALLNNTEESREKNLKELLSYRTALEVYNALPLTGVPMYRDIRAAFLKEEFKKGDEITPLSLDQLKFYDEKEYNRQMKLLEYEKKNKPPKSRDQIQLEKEIKEFKKEMENF